MKPILLTLAISLAICFGADPTAIKLDSIKGIKLIGVDIETTSYKGKPAMRVAHREGEDGRSLAILPDIHFANGTIEYEFAATVKPNAPAGYRGFTGLAFRLSGDGSRYECFYQRPLNARSQDQEQRNHSVQYISMPDYPWQRLRKETPSRYEAYADQVVGEWTRVKISVQVDKATIYINGAEQPTLIVNDLKHGASSGPLALWVDVGTTAYFANLRVSPSPVR